ncbi:uncharacterized protein [Montipora capricornis]|uniref:uncharacterized protein n=1 Tax=Montipora capricornis TaxID=246305 RepID=UPI0035F1E137
MSAFYSKAFDKVSHGLLIRKLDHYDVCGCTNKWTEAFLTERSQRVVLEGEFCDSAQVLSGVPQCSVLGPCLFLSYITIYQNPWSPILEGLFVDDTIVYLTINADSQVLQGDLDNLAVWGKEWKFHPDKCKVLRTGRKHNFVHHDYILHEKTLASVKSASHLGVTSTKDLN